MHPQGLDLVAEISENPLILHFDRMNLMDRLFVSVLGNRNSGKSSTWNELFGAEVRTGKKPRLLPLGGGQCVEVFLISGSFEERQIYAGEVLDNQDCRIVLCSVQYIEEGRDTFTYAFENQFQLFAQWLNPGYEDQGECFDRHGFIPWILGQGGTVSLRDGRIPVKPRAEELRQFIDGWATARGLAFNCP